MRFSVRHWVIALSLSVGAHLFGTAIMSDQGPVALIERGAGDPVEIASDLASTVSAQSSDDIAETVEPVTEAEDAEEVEVEEAPQPEQAEVEPDNDPSEAAAAEPLEQAEPVQQQTMAPETNVRPAEEVVEQTAEPSLNVDSADIVSPDLVKPPEVEEVEDQEEPDPLQAVTPEAAPETPPETVTEAAPDTAQPAEAVEAETVEPEFAPLPKPKPKRQVVEPVQKPKPVQKKAKPRRKAQPSQARPNSGSNRQAKPNRKPGDGGKNTRATGKANISNYMGRVASRLQRQKRYPRAAKRKKIQGTVVVSFTIRKNGSVAGVRIARRSGHIMLDQEVLAMVRRASPFPPIPANAGRSTISVTVPISFRTR